MTFSTMTLRINSIQQNDIEHNEIQHNDIQHNDIQHNYTQYIGLNATLCLIGSQHNDTSYKHGVSLRIFYSYAEYAECRRYQCYYAECRGATQLKV